MKIKKVLNEAQNKPLWSSENKAFMPRKPLNNERRHDKLFRYGEERPQALLSALSHKIMPLEARCQVDRGINAAAYTGLIHTEKYVAVF